VSLPVWAVPVLAGFTPPRAYGVFQSHGASGDAGVLGLLGNVDDKNQLDQNGPPGTAAVMGVDTDSSTGVAGHSAGGHGVAGFSDSGNGIYGGTNTGKAGLFSGDVDVTGALDVTGGLQAAGHAQIGGKLTVAVDLNVGGDVILVGADCAEDFTIDQAEAAEPGTVMVISDEHQLRVSRDPYDRRVAGVIAGAGTFRPGIRLDHRDSVAGRSPISLIGKAFCKVDATYGAIEVGDLLTTSPTAGHAMRVQDPSSAFGAVIGKALRAHVGGRGSIPILIALQ